MIAIRSNIVYILVLFVCITSCKEEKKTEHTEEVERTEKSADTPEAYIAEIMKFWPGTYNNDKQITKVKNAGEDVWLLDDTGKDGWLQIQSHYIKLDKPKIGRNVLYVEEYRDHQPDSTYRQRIYTLDIDSTETIRVKMWPFKDKKKYVGAWKNLQILDELTAEEISAYPDICDLIVSKEGDVYNMNMNGKDCAFGDKVFNYQVKLSKDVFSYRDKITTLSTGEVISTAADYQYHHLDRIQ